MSISLAEKRVTYPPTGANEHRTKIVPAGNILYHKGDPSTELFMPQSGLIFLYNNFDGEAKHMPLIVREEEILGFEAIDGKGEYEFTAVAGITSKLSRVESGLVARMAQSNSTLALRLLRTAIDTKAKLEDYRYRLVVTDSNQRTAMALLDLKDEDNHIGFKQEIVAHRVGATRITVVHSLTKLRERGIVASEGGRKGITIVDLSGLHEVASFGL